MLYHFSSAFCWKEGNFQLFKYPSIVLYLIMLLKKLFIYLFLNFDKFIWAKLTTYARKHDLKHALENNA